MKVELSLGEWIQIIERVEDDDFYYADLIAQNAIKKMREQLNLTVREER